jgi:hypothetical protein
MRSGVSGRESGAGRLGAIDETSGRAASSSAVARSASTAIMFTSQNA